MGRKASEPVWVLAKSLAGTMTDNFTPHLNEINEKRNNGTTIRVVLPDLATMLKNVFRLQHELQYETYDKNRTSNMKRFIVYFYLFQENIGFKTDNETLIRRKNFETFFGVHGSLGATLTAIMAIIDEHLVAHTGLSFRNTPNDARKSTLADRVMKDHDNFGEINKALKDVDEDNRVIDITFEMIVEKSKKYSVSDKDNKAFSFDDSDDIPEDDLYEIPVCYLVFLGAFKHGNPHGSTKDDSRAQKWSDKRMVEYLKEHHQDIPVDIFETHPTALKRAEKLLEDIGMHPKYAKPLVGFVDTVVQYPKSNGSHEFPIKMKLNKRLLKEIMAARSNNNTPSNGKIDNRIQPTADKRFVTYIESLLKTYIQARGIKEECPDSVISPDMWRLINQCNKDAGFPIYVNGQSDPPLMASTTRVGKRKRSSDADLDLDDDTELDEDDNAELDEDDNADAELDGDDEEAKENDVKFEDFEGDNSEGELDLEV